MKEAGSWRTGLGFRDVVIMAVRTCAVAIRASMLGPEVQDGNSVLSIFSGTTV